MTKKTYAIEIVYDIPTNKMALIMKIEHLIHQFSHRNECHWIESGSGFGKRDVYMESYIQPPDNEILWLKEELGKLCEYTIKVTDN